jgi:hypothetical protein
MGMDSGFRNPPVEHRSTTHGSPVVANQIIGIVAAYGSVAVLLAVADCMEAKWGIETEEDKAAKAESIAAVLEAARVTGKHE